ncbi:hypothetical protein DEO72_LG11g1325 [Vigna unguiculata]|uniref:Uncharacterized protein n=1 Tax=Vigna unguiculata TaxID=3917 RepID=A0A4D6NL14_VIGUN|nr:hypothetical protein DEO72_LG11g1325 [Vigna unguiculata]
MEENLYNLRPSESISPRLELQSLVFEFGSHFSPRRLGAGLSDLVSRPSEFARKPGCPKRDFSPKRVVLGFWATRMLAYARTVRLSEVVTRLVVLLIEPPSRREVLCFERLRVSLRQEGLA